MRRWKSCVLLAAALCAVLQTAAFATGTPLATAYKAETAILIDGKLDEWRLDSPIVIGDAAQVIRDADFWLGPMDCSCKAYVMWDEENLYLAVDVNEDTPFGAIEMLPLDGMDNFKLYISTDPSADPARTAYGTNDFLLYLIVDNQYWDTGFDRSMVDKDLRQRFMSKGMDGGENVLEGYRCAVQLTTTGFIYEAVDSMGGFLQQLLSPSIDPQPGDPGQIQLRNHRHRLSMPRHGYVPQMAGQEICESTPIRVCGAR